LILSFRDNGAREVVFFALAQSDYLVRLRLSEDNYIARKWWAYSLTETRNFNLYKIIVNQIVWLFSESVETNLAGAWVVVGAIVREEGLSSVGTIGKVSSFNANSVDHDSVCSVSTVVYGHLLAVSEHWSCDNWCNRCGISSGCWFSWKATRIISSYHLEVQVLSNRASDDLISLDSDGCFCGWWSNCVPNLRLGKVSNWVKLIDWCLLSLCSDRRLPVKVKCSYETILQVSKSISSFTGWSERKLEYSECCSSNSTLVVVEIGCTLRAWG
jgi:hypothetical protein